MSPFVTYLLLLSFGLVALVLLVELVRSKSLKSFLIQAGILAAVFVVLKVTTGFPAPRQTFGGAAPTVAIAIMFVSTLLGISARYFYYSRKFGWRSFLKPMFITPIVLLPLMGSVQTASSLESVQVISLAFLSFQNGFFWKVVLEHAEPKL